MNYGQKCEKPASKVNLSNLGIAFPVFILEPKNTSNNALCYDFEALKKWISRDPFLAG